MPQWIFYISTGLTVVILIVTLILWRRLSAEDGFRFSDQFEGLEKAQAETERTLRDEMARMRNENLQADRSLREELLGNLRGFGESLFARMMEHSTLQKNQLDAFAQQLGTLIQTTEQKLDQVRQTLQEQLQTMQEDNSRKLELMRATVDEKLQTTLEKRLGESFKLVSERLEMVHKGLGEMQTLAIGVGDLKKVLSNVKSRGYWGEIQLGNIIEELLTPDQFGKNVATKKGSSEIVEYAVKLPGRGDSKDDIVWLPVDAKFPLEDYHRLLDAHDQGDKDLVETVHKQLAQRIKGQAKDIRDKYIDPPHTTDFGIMFLPTESLFAEVLRIPGLCEELQRTYRVSVAGPTTLGALLNSLSLGFRTLAIEKRSSEVWKLLGEVKNDFGNFQKLLGKTSKKLQEASNQIEEATKRSRIIEKKLTQVQELPASEAAALIGDTEELDAEELDEPEGNPSDE